VATHVSISLVFEIKDGEFSKAFPSMDFDSFVKKPLRTSDLIEKILSTID
jgi:hypothetical protein